MADDPMDPQPHPEEKAPMDPVRHTSVDERLPIRLAVVVLALIASAVLAVGTGSLGSPAGVEASPAYGDGF